MQYESKILGLAVKRGVGSEPETALAGFPHHSFLNFICPN
jgi:hypothetical protein